MGSPENTKKTILVLGSGFLGKAICNSLRSNNYPVRVFSKSILDNPSSGFYKGNLGEINKHIHVLENVDTVIHTIHTTVPVTSMVNMVYDVESNVCSTIKLLECMNQKQVKKIIFISSGGAAYGIPENNPVGEVHSTNPISSYGISKLMIEKYMQLYQREHDFLVTILRVSNIYGEAQQLDKPQGVIGYLVNSILKEKEFVIWGSSTIKKDYLYIDDFVRGVLKVIEQPSDSSLFNLSYGKSYSLSEIIGVIESLTAKKLKVKVGEGKKFDVSDISLNNSLFKNTFQWEPEVSMAQGLSLILSKIVGKSMR